MHRRTFLGAVAAGFVAAALTAEAQRAGKTARVGVLWPYSPTATSPFADALRQGLRELGYVEGKSVVLEERWAEGRLDRLPSLAAELVGLKVDVIVTMSTPAGQAAARATTTIPIVITLVADPVESGIVANLARPGGNVTGLSLMQPELNGKRVALLKEVVPKLSRVGVFWSPTTPSHARVLRETDAAARSRGMQIHPVEVHGAGDLDTAFAALVRERDGALVVLPDALFRDQQRRIIDLAATHRLPAIYFAGDLVTAGGLMAYGAADFHEDLRQAAAFVDKILKGARPADLPIVQPSKFELIINLRTAKALGLAFRQSLLQRADQVVE